MAHRKFDGLPFFKMAMFDNYVKLPEGKSNRQGAPAFDPVGQLRIMIVMLTMIVTVCIYIIPMIVRFI